MIVPHFLTWIYWNPNPNVFVIPYLNHPLRWYGLLFVFGFIVGYWILLSLLTKKLSNQKRIYERDILNWSILIENLSSAVADPKSPIHQLALRIPKKLLHADTPSSSSHQEELLAALSQALEDPTLNLNRKFLEQNLPNSIIKEFDLAILFTDRLTWYTVAGTIIGARLGHVFFYEWPRYKNHLLDIFKVWEGGLASHGGTIGVLLAVWLFYRINRKTFPEMTFINLMDMFCIPVAFVAFCIRMGNFVNQEILGVETSQPWGIIFGNPYDGSAPVPRHPVQLYEGFSYLAIFFLLLKLWKSDSAAARPGFISGLFFALVFGSRFFIEFLKEPTSLMVDESFLQTGQILSLPCIAAGLILIFYGKKLNSKSS